MRNSPSGIIEHRKVITKLETGSTYLSLEEGRDKNIPRDDRVCPICKKWHWKLEALSFEL